MRILIFILFLLTFISSKKTSDRYLVQEKCIALRAILPLLIILHHCSDFMGIPYIDADFGILGGAVVGIFFFFSGYGMELKREKNLLKLSELPSRIGKLLYQLIIPTILFYSVVYTQGLDIFETFTKTVSDNFCTLPYSWYISSLCILYFLFYLSAVLTAKWFLGCLLLFLVVIHTINIILDTPNYTYLSNLAFLSGVVYKHYESRIVNLRLEYLKWPCILCLGFLTVFAMKFSDITRPLYRFLWTFSFMALYSTLPSIRINHLVKYLNSIGLQMYLCQGIAFALIPFGVFDGTLRTLFITGLTIAIASIVSWLYTQLNFNFKR